MSSLQVGGTEKLLIDFIKSSKVNSNDVNFTVVIMNAMVDDELKKELLATNYKVYFINKKSHYKHPKYIFRLLKIVAENNVEIIHSHDFGGKAWSILCKLLNPQIKLIYTIHDSIVIKNLNEINLLIHRFFIDMNIAISENIYKNCIENKLLKSIKIYNGLSVNKFINLEPKQINGEFLKIINVARITYYKKGHDILIKALKECKGRGVKFKCDFIGGVYDYDSESFEYLQKMIKEMDLEDEINFLGNRNDVVELLSGADLFVLPSRYEGLPISLLEAMASKLPVIASNISGSNDLIKHGENGLLFESENHFELADKIIYLYNNREEMNKLAQDAYEHVQGFDISVMCKNYIELYKSLV